MSVDYIAIGKRIKIARSKIGITQEKLAELAHLSTSHVSKIETGDTKLGLPTIVDIANALHTSVDALLADSVVYPDVFLKKDVDELLDGLSRSEIRIMTETMAALRKSIIAARIKENE